MTAGLGDSQVAVDGGPGCPPGRALSVGLLASAPPPANCSYSERNSRSLSISVQVLVSGFKQARSRREPKRAIQSVPSFRYGLMAACTLSTNGCLAATASPSSLNISFLRTNL